MKHNLNRAVAKVLKRLHYPLDVVLTFVRWVCCVSAEPVPGEMMAAGGNSVDHSIVHLWALKLLPVLEKASRVCKWAVGRSWRMDETYIRIRGRIILGSIAFIHMIVEGQMKDGGIAQPLAYQFYSLAA